MNAIIAWFAENKVAANLLMVFVVVAGIISLQDTRKEILPIMRLVSQVFIKHCCAVCV